jgi:YD repeat-containing protein
MRGRSVNAGSHAAPARRRGPARQRLPGCRRRTCGPGHRGEGDPHSPVGRRAHRVRIPPAARGCHGPAGSGPRRRVHRRRGFGGRPDAGRRGQPHVQPLRRATHRHRRGRQHCELRRSGPASAGHRSAPQHVLPYDRDGRRTSRTDAAGTATFTDDTAGRFKTAVNSTTGINVTTYNVMSQPTAMVYGGVGGNTRTLTYDAMRRLKTDTLKNSAGTVTLGSNAYGAGRTPPGHAGVVRSLA